MLKNISHKAQQVKWDGVIRVIESNQVFSVLDLFDVSKSDAIVIEAHIKNKNKSIVEAEGAGEAQRNPEPEAPAAPTEVKKDEETEPPATGFEKRTSLSDHSKKELKEMALGLGCTVTATMNKEELIKAIEAKQEPVANEEDEG